MFLIKSQLLADKEVGVEKVSLSENGLEKGDQNVCPIREDRL